MSCNWNIVLARLWIMAFVLLSGVASAQEERPPAGSNQQIAQALRREWVRKQLAKLLTDPRERAEINARLDGLTDDQIQALASLCLDELEARRRQQLQVLKEANARERAFR